MFRVSKWTAVCRVVGSAAAPVLAGLFLLAPASVSAGDVRVLTAGAFKSMVQALAPEFERQSGNRLIIANDTVGGIVKRVNVAAGATPEAFDVLIVSPAGMRELVKSGRVLESSVVNLAKTGVGVAVKAGSPMPDISTVAALQKALLEARAVAYIDPAAGGTSGIYFAGLLDRWGIADRVKSRAVLVPGGLVAERLVTGQADLAIHQISEILAVPGATLVGPLPAEVQSFTVYAAGRPVAPKDAQTDAAAAALVAMFTSDAGRALLKQKGMDTP
ncbi:MAG: substrate-binding domain-containing protein [Burkholderiales bacterium]|nr:substrate-binding domain-containing protein [Burkholderiales bacterium]